MDNKKYGLYKRIMKRDPKAIDEIETLDEAKEMLKMMAGNIFLNGKVYNDLINLDVEKFMQNRNESVEPDID